MSKGRSRNSIQAYTYKDILYYTKIQAHLSSDFNYFFIFYVKKIVGREFSVQRFGFLINISLSATQTKEDTESDERCNNDTADRVNTAAYGNV